MFLHLKPFDHCVVYDHYDKNYCLYFHQRFIWGIVAAIVLSKMQVEISSSCNNFFETSCNIFLTPVSIFFTLVATFVSKPSTCAHTISASGGKKDGDDDGDGDIDDDEDNNDDVYSYDDDDTDINDDDTDTIQTSSSGSSGGEGRARPTRGCRAELARLVIIIKIIITWPSRPKAGWA